MTVEINTTVDKIVFINNRFLDGFEIKLVD